MKAQAKWSDRQPRPSGCPPQKEAADPGSAWTGEDARRSTGFSEGFLRWLKFNAVGGIGIAVQLAALALFRSALRLDYLLATALAVETAVIHNFLWHERFTWADRPAQRFLHSLARLAKFNASNGLVSLVGNVLIMRVLVGQFHMNYLIANLIAVATCSIVNFLLSDRFVFES
jgi:putative flippase GtrA